MLKALSGNLDGNISSIEFEPFSYERENFHVCWSTGTHLFLHAECRILLLSTPINNRCCYKYMVVH